MQRIPQGKCHSAVTQKGLRVPWCMGWAREHVGTARPRGRHPCVQTQRCPSQLGAHQETPRLHRGGKEVTSPQRRAEPPLHSAGSPPGPSPLLLPRHVGLHPNISPGQSDTPWAGFFSRIRPPRRAHLAGDGAIPGSSISRGHSGRSQGHPSPHGDGHATSPKHDTNAPRESRSSGFGPGQAPVGEAWGARRGRRAAGRALLGKPQRCTSSRHPQERREPGTPWCNHRNISLALQPAPGCPGEGRDGCAAGPRRAHGPKASGIAGSSSGKPGCQGRGSRCSSGQGGGEIPNQELALGWCESGEWEAWWRYSLPEQG